MNKIVSAHHAHAYPGRVAIVTSRFGEEVNMMASGWHTYLGSAPETYGISIRKETRSWSLIEQSGVFGLNFVSAEHSAMIHDAGTLTGFEVNKFQQTGVGFSAGSRTGVPILDDAYLSYECEVVDIRPYGDHYLLAGVIVQTYKDERCFLSDGSVNLETLPIPLYIGRSSYRTLNAAAPLENHWTETRKPS